MGRPGQNFKDQLSLILACLVVLALSGAWLYAKQAAGIDYYVTWVAADAIETTAYEDFAAEQVRHGAELFSVYPQTDLSRQKFERWRREKGR